MDQKRRPVCTFLIPLVRDSDRKPHGPILWRILQDALVSRYGGYSGPVLHCYRSRGPTPGAWSPKESEASLEDECRKYTVAISADRLDELRALLRRAGNSFDQRVVYIEVAGYAEFLEPQPEDGFLEI